MTIRKNKLQNIIEKIVLDEMMAVGIGGVATGQIAGGPALPIGSKLVIPKDIKQPAGRKKRRLTTEANTVTGMQLTSYGLNDIEQMQFTLKEMPKYLLVKKIRIKFVTNKRALCHKT
jgi:hypothetical protein